VPRIAGVRGAADGTRQRHAVVADDLGVRHLLDREFHVGKLGLPAGLEPGDSL